MSSDTLLFFTSPNTDKTFENVSINVNPSFDIAIFYYKKIIDHNKITLKLKSLGQVDNYFCLIHETEGKGQILQKIDEFLTINKLYKKYKYIGIVDDDLVCSFSCINEIISIAKEYKLDSYQPSLTKESIYSHKFTLKKDNAPIHYVKWVEIMCPIYDSKLFKLSASFFKESISSWGLDCYVFPIISRINSYSRHAVIDKVSISHIRKIRSDQIRYSNGLNAKEEMDKLRKLMTNYLVANHPNLLIYEDIQLILNFR